MTNKHLLSSSLPEPNDESEMRGLDKLLCLGKLEIFWKVLDHLLSAYKYLSECCQAGVSLI